MATNFIDEEQWHREHGHKRRFRWVVRRKFIRGPRQPRKVALVVLTPRYDSNFSVTLPRSHITKWYLECGHSALPTRRIGGARGEYEDPEQATVWCNACEVALDTVEETREKEYYWEDGHEHREFACHECRQCWVCKGHKPDCSEPTREYLMELIFDPACDLPAEQRETFCDSVRALVDLLDKKQLGDAIDPYVDAD